MRIFKALILSLVILFAMAQESAAQNVNTSWSQCTDGRNIARCETYDCPQGDTNGDGKCTLTDDDARLTDARNDSFCANPISGCGQVHYYPSGASQSCLVRVEEQANCDLYAIASPNFTPSPGATPSPKATATATASAVPSTTKGGGDKELPKTGPEHVFAGALVLLLGAAGAYLFEKYKTI